MNMFWIKLKKFQKQLTQICVFGYIFDHESIQV